MSGENHNLEDPFPTPQAPPAKENDGQDGITENSVMDKRLLNLKKWEPGQSGNPSGKPKGTKHRSTIVSKWLDVEENTTNPLTKEQQLLSQEDLIILAQLKKARQGDTKAFDTLMDSKHGKIPNKQEVDLTVQDTLAVAKLTKGMKEDGYTAEEIVAYLENGGLEEVENG